MKKGIYKNIVELAKSNNVYDEWCNVVDCGDGRTLEEYLDDYSDRDIVTMVLCDNLDQSVKFKVHHSDFYLEYTEDGTEIPIKWRSLKVEIL